MDTKELPIGVFDSGVGGISVLQCAAKLLPNENFIYYGDTKNAPYGNKSEKEIQTLTLASCEFLYHKGVKALVIACNTATSATIMILREKYNIPVISIEPAVKPASEASPEGLIVVMATPATVSQKRYRLLVERLGCVNRVVNIPCDGLADLVEKGDFESEEIKNYIDTKLNPLAGENVSGIVIGCTHYSFIADMIARSAKSILHGACRLFDGRYGVARQLKHVLEERALLREGQGGNVAFYSSGNAEDEALMEKIFHS